MPHVAPFSVAEMVVTSLEAFMSAAALNLGEATPDGRNLAAPDALEAWRALLAATGLLNQFSPMMNETLLVPYQAGLAHLLQTFVARHPDLEVPVPSWLQESIRHAPIPVASLDGVVAEELGAIAGGVQRPAPAEPTPPRAPAKPGTGLPQRPQTGLFPR